MRAALLHRYGEPLTITDVPKPELRPGEALVRVFRNCICGTDLKIQNGDIKVPLPLIMGHEITGILEDAKPSNDLKKERINENI